MNTWSSGVFVCRVFSLLWFCGFLVMFSVDFVGLFVLGVDFCLFRCSDFSH